MEFAQGDIYHPSFPEPPAAAQNTNIPDVWVLVANKYGQLWDFTDSLFRTSGAVFTKKSGEMVKNGDANLWSYNPGWVIPSGINTFRMQYRDTFGTIHPGELIHVTISGSGGGGGSLTASGVWGHESRTITAGGTSAQEVWEYGTRTLTDKAGFSIAGTKTTLDALADLSAGQVKAQMESVITAYEPLKASVSGRLLDVSAAGTAGIDWGNIEAPDTVVSLGGTTVRGSGMIITTVTGAVGSVTGNVGGNVVGSTGSIASSGILISSLQPEASNEIADRVLRRGLANVEAVADSRSLAWGVAKLVNKVAISSNTLTVNRTDDTTVVFSQAITTSGGALPITAVDTS